MRRLVLTTNMYLPFVYDTFGFLALEAVVELLRRVQLVMHSNVMTQISINLVSKRLSFTIQKRLAAHHIPRLTSYLDRNVIFYYETNFSIKKENKI